MFVAKKEFDHILFTKMSGHGNDFIIIDNRSGSINTDWKDCASAWCERSMSIGADGLLVIDRSSMADFKLRIFNSDGSEAEMCGNGARCAAKYAVENGIAEPSMMIETLAGVIMALVEESAVAIKLTDPESLHNEFSVDVSGGDYLMYSVNSGVPHAVTFRDHVGELSADEILKVGHSIRFHPAFQPEGTNVDFVEVVGPQVIRVRTYERGVEAETLACGTGAVASAVVSHLFTKVGDPPIVVQMPGGILTVDFSSNGAEVENVWLSGDVKWICSGELFSAEVSI